MSASSGQPICAPSWRAGAPAAPARAPSGAGSPACARSCAILERRGLANAAGAAALRAPKQPKSLPKPLTAGDARRVVSAGEQLAEEPWIAARNAAVLTLLYGSGLRISEALGLAAADLAGERDAVIRVTGKGGKTRLGAGAADRPQGRRRIPAALPVPSRSARPAVSRRARRAAAAGDHPARDAQAARRRSICPIRRRRMRCAIPSPRICSAAAAICAPSRNCSAMPACRRRRSIPASTPTGCSKSTSGRIRAPDTVQPRDNLARAD